MHANVTESHRPLCTSHSCTRRETEAVGDVYRQACTACTHPTYSQAGWWCVDEWRGVWMAGWVVRGRLCYTAMVGVSRILLVGCPINPDPSGNLIVNKAEIQTNITGSSSMGGRVDLEWCGISTVDLQGTR